ncbi:MAG: nucleotide sugar dehydrogenase [Cellulophaga sp.]
MSAIKISIIGLGYVGLPLAHLFASKYAVIGYDINYKRINELQKGIDNTLELSSEELKKVSLESSNTTFPGLFFTKDIGDIKDSNYYIITVPTPVDNNNKPDLSSLFKATKTIGRILKKDAIVIYESTVYPGATEEECVPILEEESGLLLNKDFFIGYSPERINPGDKEHTIDKILKVTSGSTPEIGRKIDKLYASVIVAGTYLAPSIKVAEAAKVIENSQRDINIAFVNELSKIFNLMNIDTNEVLKAARTKWNFLPFQPGLVGGHCIGVDPYYLAQKAQEYGYHPEIILAGRRMNDSMGKYVAAEVVKLMLRKEIKIKDASVLILGITFKENCQDVRNTKVVDVIKNLESYGSKVTVYDPWAHPDEVNKEYNIAIATKLPLIKFDTIVLAVAHNEFLSLDFKKLRNPLSIIYDVKNFLTINVDGKL